MGLCPLTKNVIEKQKGLLQVQSGSKTSAVKTVCARDCPDTCFLDATIKDGRIISTKGSDENPVTQGFLCPRGMGDPKRVYSRERILYPHIKDGNGFRRASWSEAIAFAAGKLTSVLKDYGSESVLMYDYAGNQGCLSWHFSQRLWRAVGVTLTDGALCSASGHAGIKLHYGLAYGLGFEDILNCSVILFWGNNARVSSPHLWTLSLKARNNKGAKLVSIDPRKSETSEACDYWINPRPGSDVALFYGIARYLIEHGKLVQEFIDKWTTGYKEFKEEVDKWDRERVEKTTNLTWGKIEELCELLVEKPPLGVLIGLGLNKSSHGAEAARAASLLPALLGQHRGFHYSDAQGRFVDWDYLNGSKLSRKTSRIVEQVSLGSRLNLGEFKFVFVKGSNPALTLPGQSPVRAGFSREDSFIVVHDTHWTETTKLADIVLPAPTYLEKSDLNFSDHHPYTRISVKAIEPLGESKDEIWFMQQFGRALKCEESWVFENPWRALQEATVEAFENGRFEDLLGGTILKLRQRPVDDYQTPSKKIELNSSKALEIGANPLPVQLSIEEKKDWFILLNSSLPNWTHSQFRDVYGPIPAIVWINNKDAENLGIRDGEDVVLLNELGTLTANAVVTEKVSEGILWSPRPLTGKNGVPLNSLASHVPQTLGRGPRFNSIRVKVKAN